MSSQPPSNQITNEIESVPLSSDSARELPQPSSPPSLRQSKGKAHSLRIRPLKLVKESVESKGEKLITTPIRSAPFYQQITKSGIQMIETMVDLRTNTPSRSNRAKRDTNNKSITTGNGDKRKNQSRTLTSTRRASESNATGTLNAQKNIKEEEDSIKANQKRLRAGSLIDVKERKEEHALCQENDASSATSMYNLEQLTLEERIHEHALAAAVVAKSFPSNGKHSTTFEMIESTEGDNKPDKIVRVHVIADRFSACIPCRRRKIRCMPSDEMPRPNTGTCGTCLRRGKTCVWTDDGHHTITDKKEIKKKYADLDQGQTSIKQSKHSKRKRLSVKQEHSLNHLQSCSQLHGADTVHNIKQSDYPDTAHLMDPPKFENINWAGMQYPPFYNASDVNPFLSPTTDIPQSTLLALEKHGYPHCSNGPLSANFSGGSPSSTLHSPSTPTTWATAPILKSEPVEVHTLNIKQNDTNVHHRGSQHQEQNPYSFHPIERSHSTPSVQVPTIMTGNMMMMNEYSSSNLNTSHSSSESMPSSYFSATLGTFHRHNGHLSLQNQGVPPFSMPTLARAHSFHCVSGMGQKDFSEAALNGQSMMMREMSFDCNSLKLNGVPDTTTSCHGAHSDISNANLFVKNSEQENVACDGSNDQQHPSSFFPPSPHHLAISTPSTLLPSLSNATNDKQVLIGHDCTQPNSEVKGLIQSDKPNNFVKTADWVNSDALRC